MPNGRVGLEFRFKVAGRNFGSGWRTGVSVWVDGLRPCSPGVVSRRSPGGLMVSNKYIDFD